MTIFMAILSRLSHQLKLKLTPTQRRALGWSGWSHPASTRQGKAKGRSNKLGRVQIQDLCLLALYSRIAWLPAHNAMQQVILSLCPSARYQILTFHFFSSSGEPETASQNQRWLLWEEPGRSPLLNSEKVADQSQCPSPSHKHAINTFTNKVGPSFYCKSAMVLSNLCFLAE